MIDLIEETKKINDELIEIRRQLHQMPELDMNLPKSKAFIENKLREFNCEPESVGKCGVVVTLGSGEKTILIRADYDGLPIVEAAEVKFKSTNGAMHACGHDIHATMLLGTAKLLKKWEDKLNCRVKLMFQPGEETANGAIDMIAAGVIDDVDAAYMIHVMSGAGIPTGKIITTRVGSAMAASTYFKIDITGQGGHGSTPFLAIDPINIANHLVLNLQTITSRETNIFDPTVISIGKIQAGEAYNIIPQTASLEGTLRTFSKENHQFVTKRIAEIAQATATAFRGKCKIEIKEIMPSLIQSAEIYPQTLTNLEKLFGRENIMSIKEIIGTDMISASEDFAFISEQVPTACLFLALGTGEAYGLHHPKVTFDENYMYMGVSTFCNIALASR